MHSTPITLAGSSPEPFVADVRRYELARVRNIFTKHGQVPPCQVLEIGGGAGWQARELAQSGYSVISVDIEPRASVFKVEMYDGHRLPSADRSFDVVFSSNVLEHIPHVVEFQDELHRVLKPGGLAVHLMPSPTWRLATLLAHYPWLVRVGLALLSGSNGADRDIVISATGKRNFTQLFGRVVLAPRHGETGNAISELWHFRAKRWGALFKHTDWRLLESSSNGLFYTGYTICGHRLSWGARRGLADVLGGACNVFVLTH